MFGAGLIFLAVWQSDECSNGHVGYLLCVIEIIDGPLQDRTGKHFRVVKNESRLTFFGLPGSKLLTERGTFHSLAAYF